MLLNKRKDTRAKFNPGLKANWPSNNWAQYQKQPQLAIPNKVTQH